MTQQQQLVVTCQCGHQYPVTQALGFRDASEVGPEYIQFYLRCPHCNHETHTHYVTPEIRRLQTHVQHTIEVHKRLRKETTWEEIKKAKAQLDKVWDRVNPKRKHPCA
jgi:pyruvate/2-oxoacid:ferredoxin oxidoreductase beta subunit